MTLGAALFCVAGAALGGPQSHFAWHVHNLEHHPHNTIYTTSSDTPLSTQHHLHCIINTTPSTQHRPHSTIYTTSPNTPSSTQPHPHITIYTTPSTQHHLHYIIKHNIIKHWQVQHLEALPSPFCFSSLWIVLCFVSLAYSTVG